jgi:flagellar motor protein MotB
MQKEGRGERALLFPAEQNELERKLNRRVEVVIR